MSFFRARDWEGNDKGLRYLLYGNLSLFRYLYFFGHKVLILPLIKCQLYKFLLLIHEFIDLVKVYPFTLLLSRHPQNQIEKMVHTHRHPWSYWSRHADLSLSKLIYIIFVVLVLSQDVRMSACYHFEEYHSQWKYVALCARMVIRNCQLLERHVMKSTLSLLAELHTLVENGKPKVRNFEYAILNQYVFRFQVLVQYFLFP